MAQTSGESQARQIIKELCPDVLEGRLLSQKIDFLAGEMETAEILDGLRETGNDQIRPVRRQRVHEQLKHGRLPQGILKIRRRHGQFIQIRR